MKLTLVFSSLLFLLISSVAAAEPPGTIYFEGQLKDSIGMPFNGTYDLIFTIYDDSTDGRILWQESHLAEDDRAVLIENGFFGVTLGLKNKIPSAVINQSGNWLAIEIENRSERFPRTSLFPGAYSYDRFDYKGRHDEIKTRRICQWKDRGSPGCRFFPVTEWSLNCMVASRDFQPPLRQREPYEIATEIGFIRTLSHNSGLGATVYIALSDDSRLGTRLRYRQWLSDYYALDFSTGTTWNVLRRDVQDEITGKAGFTSAIGINFRDQFIFHMEYAVFPTWEWQGSEANGKEVTQRALYLGVAAGSEVGIKMIGATAVVIVLVNILDLFGQIDYLD